MQFPPRAFDVHGIRFTVRYAKEGAFVVAILDCGEPTHDLLASCLTACWKLFPVDLLESLRDRRLVRVGEFYTITYGDGEPPPGSEEFREDCCVNIFDGERELDVTESFFAAVVTNLAKGHLDLVGRDHFPWFDRLTPAAAWIFD
jgi:hypothetical protein